MAGRSFPRRVHAGSVWSQRLADPGWQMLPLRGFLGVTFVYAGLQKMADPRFFDPRSPASIVGQMRALQHSSPIGPLVAASAHVPVLVGVVIALGELAVGAGALLGLYTRVASAGGALLALSFFLTVSWATTPYYYGADIVFVFAWLTLLGVGDRGVLSVQSLLRDHARTAAGVGPEPARVTVSAERLHAMCPRGPHCGLSRAGTCDRRDCPIFPVTEHLPHRVRAAVDRGTALHSRRVAVLAAATAAAIAGLTAVVGRLVGGTRQASAALPGSAVAPTGGPAGTSAPTVSTSSAPATPGPSDSAGAGAGSPGSARHIVSTPETSAAAPTAARPGTTAASSTASAPAGTAIGAAADVPVGKARPFTDPASGDPAWLVRPSATRFVAFDAVCTHAGCTVSYNPTTVQFDCPCHGGVYDARTGRVLQGPPPAPLRPIPVHVVHGQLRVDA